MGNDAFNYRLYPRFFLEPGSLTKITAEMSRELDIDFDFIGSEFVYQVCV